MDLNYLLHREQVSLMRARAAQCTPSRSAHSRMARDYGALIAALPYPHRSGQPRMLAVA